MGTKFTIPNYILAPKTIRAVNFAIDLILMKIISAILYFIAAFVEYDDNNSILNWLNTFDEAQSFLLWILIMFSYYATFEIIFSKTLSKYFTKTIVVLADGTKPKPIDILGRTLVRLIPFEYLTFLRGIKPGWHDELSKTYVVKKEKLENSKKEFLEFKK